MGLSYSRIRASIGLIFGLFLLLFFFQNCGLQAVLKFKNENSNQSSLEMGGNGEGYDGKPTEGEFSRFVPNHPCEELGKPYSTLSLGQDLARVEISNPDTCQYKSLEIQLSEAKYSSFNRDFVKFREGVYIRSVLRTKKPDTQHLESLCSQREGPHIGLEILTYNDKGKAKAEIIHGWRSPLTGGLLKNFKPSGPLSRSQTRSSLEYKNEGFHLTIAIGQFANLKRQSYSATFTGQIQGQKTTLALTCHLAHKLDSQALPLKISGNSSPQAPAPQRVFYESLGSPWTLNGKCDSESGPVEILGLSTPLRVPCDSNGEFSHSLSFRGPNTFAASPFYGRHLQIAQAPATPRSTTLYLIPTGSPPLHFIMNAQDLQNMTFNTQHIYVLTRDIDLAQEVGPTNNWRPIGGGSTPPVEAFTGAFEGDGHRVLNLNLTDNRDGVGFFGALDTNTGYVRNLELVNVQVDSTGGYVGGLVGHQRMGTRISNVHLRNVQVSGNSFVGGLAGHHWMAKIEKSSVSGGQVLARQTMAGGLVGNVNSGDISQVFSSVSVTSLNGYAGGLLGNIFNGDPNSPSLYDCYSKGEVRSPTIAAGLAAMMDSMSRIDRCYSTSPVIATDNRRASPLVLFSTGRTPAQQTYFSYYSQQAPCQGCDEFSEGRALNPLELLIQDSYQGWDFTTPIWTINEGLGPPALVPHN